MKPSNNYSHGKWRPAILALVVVALVLLACRPKLGGNRGRLKRHSFDAIAVAAYSKHTCLLLPSGNPRCFGGDDGNAATPTPKDALSKIETGARYACGIRKRDESLVCWGDCTGGVCTPPPGRFAELSLDSHKGGCAWSRAGVAQCWGSRLDAPTGSFTAGTRVSQLVFGQGWGAALRTNSTLLVWGRGAVVTDPRVTALVSGRTPLSAIGGRGALLCVIDPAGKLSCFAHHQNRQPPAGSGRALQVDAANPRGAMPACVLREAPGGAKSLSCSRSNKGHALPRLSGDILDIAVANDHVCALFRGGKVECAGDDLYGRVTGKSALGSVDWN